MSLSIRTVLLLGLWGAGGTLGACGGYVNLGDPLAGAGGEAADASAGGAGNTGGIEAGAGPTTGADGGTAADVSAEAGAGGDVSAAAGKSGSSAQGGTGGSSAQGGTGGSSAQGGTGGSSAQGGTGATGAVGNPAYEPREGSFEMLVYFKTTGFNHSSIAAGQQMFEEMALERDFEVTMTDTNEEFTLEGLSKYEIVFFLNTTGDVLNADEEQAFETWITTQNGAFAGVHAAADTERDWAFYKELTGQYFDLHSSVTSGDVVLEDAASNFPGMTNLPNPWQRREEWFRFNQHAEWSTKPGFTILARHAANNHPVSWIREHANFRAFYTSLGHEALAYEDDALKAHIAGGIFWAVRREHLFQE